jgi:hypothetical protein
MRQVFDCGNFCRVGLFSWVQFRNTGRRSHARPCRLSWMWLHSRVPGRSVADLSGVKAQSRRRPVQDGISGLDDLTVGQFEKALRRLSTYQMRRKISTTDLLIEVRNDLIDAQHHFEVDRTYEHERTRGKYREMFLGILATSFSAVVADILPQWSLLSVVYSTATRGTSVSRVF